MKLHSIQEMKLQEKHEQLGKCDAQVFHDMYSVIIIIVNQLGLCEQFYNGCKISCYAHLDLNTISLASQLECIIVKCTM